MVKYWGWMVPPGYAAITLGPVIFMRRRFRDDVALLAHEQVHVRQWQQHRLLFWPRYLLSRRWRLAYEVEAYRVQVQMAPAALEHCVQALTRGYWLGISEQDARRLLCH